MLKLSNRITAVFLVLFLLPFIGIGSVLLYRSYNSAVEQKISQLTSYAVSAASSTRSYFSETTSELQYLSRISGVSPDEPQKAEKLMLSLISSEHNYNWVSVINSIGKEITRVHRTDVINLIDLKDYSQNKIFTVPFHDNVPYTSNVITDKITGQNVFIISVPIIGANGAVKGVIAAEARLKSLRYIFETEYPSENVDLVLTDGSGKIVAHPNISYVLSDNFFRPDGTGHFSKWLDNSKVMYSSSSVLTASADYTAYAVSNAHIQMKDNYLMIEIFAGALIIIALTSFMFLHYLLSNITVTVKSLRNVMDNISEGDIEARVPQNTGNELFGLCSSFNIAADTYTDELNRLKDENDNLHTNNERLNTALETAEIGVWDYYTADENTYFNNVWYTMLGYKPYSLPEKFETWQNLVQPDDYDAVFAEFESALKNGSPYNKIMRMQCADGEYKYINTIGKVASLDENGNPDRLSGIHQDVTDNVLKDKLLQSKTNQLEEMNLNLEKQVSEEIARRVSNERMLMQQSKLAAMGDLIISISHQWRQPLNSIGLLMQDILETKRSEGKIDMDYLIQTVNLAMNLLNRMSQTIDEFGTFFKSDDKITVFSTVESVISVFSVMNKRFDSSGVETKLYLNDSEINMDDAGLYFNYATVKGYTNEFKNVIINLMLNSLYAVQDVDEPLIKVSIDDSSDTEVRITFSDNGHGISDDVRERIFEPYFSTKDEGEGVGLGLYMSKMAVEGNMRGKIYNKEVSEGSEFIIILPSADSKYKKQ